MKKNSVKNLYLAIVQSKNGKFFASVQKVGENNNLYSFINAFKNVSSVNIYPKEKCYRIVNIWNECYKNNGTLMDSDTLTSIC